MVASQNTDTSSGFFVICWLSSKYKHFKKLVRNCTTFHHLCWKKITFALAISMLRFQDRRDRPHFLIGRMWSTKCHCCHLVDSSYIMASFVIIHASIMKTKLRKQRKTAWKLQRIQWIANLFFFLNKKPKEFIYLCI